MEKLSDGALRAKTDEFRERLGEGETLDDILPEAYAVVRETSRRTLGMRPFDVQVMGGIALHQGKIAEMKTGEGKTLAATMPVYLNALNGKGVHIVTVNDYLARRDASWMGEIYEFLGLKVGLIQDNMGFEERKVAYDSDLTYGTNAQFGFDYLRDNIATSTDQLVQRELNFAIVDEVDSILIDEARTPLIISGMPESAADVYYRFAAIIPRLREGEDYEVDEKKRQIAPTESGVEKVEKALGVENLYDDVNTNLVNHLNQALRAHALFHKDVEYIVRDGQVFIVDEFTGRVLEGRRYSEGLHQAIEAKEGVEIREENQTVATITIQNFFRQYDKLSGMTGTAATEADEFMHIYKMEVVSIPTHKDMIRDDRDDLVYKTKKAKYGAVVDDIVERNRRASRSWWARSPWTSPSTSRLLKRRGIRHNVLNAKQHEREAEIIAEAGERGAVTIATNMAGRGTDIKLGPRVAGARRPLRARDRAPRVAPHRQPAQGPLRAPGRPRRVSVLPLFRGRSVEALRRRADAGRHRPHRARGRRADRGRHDLQLRQARAGAGREPQLPDPQTDPRVRRRAQQAARGDLRHKARHPDGRGRGHVELRRGGAHGGRLPVRLRTTSTRRSGTWTTLAAEVNRFYPTTIDFKALTSRTSRARRSWRWSSPTPASDWRSARPSGRSGPPSWSGAASRAPTASRPSRRPRGGPSSPWSTPAGASTSTRWTTCARALAGAASPAGPARRVQARGLRHIPGDGAGPQGGLRYLHLSHRERHAARGGDAAALLQRWGEEPNQRPKSPRSSEGKIGRNDPCPCGSGKKYKKCGLQNTPEHQRLMAQGGSAA